MGLITKVHCFKYNNAEGYAPLREKLALTHGREFDALSVYQSADKLRADIEKLDGKQIELATKQLFNNQWNTVEGCITPLGARVFDWRHYRRISNGDAPLTFNGYWLEQTPEMIEIRSNIVTCGYCGRQYTDRPSGSWCDACLGSEYLAEDTLHLLKLIPVAEDVIKSGVRDGQPPEDVVARYHKEQQRCSVAREKKGHARMLRSLKLKIESVEKEFEAAKWMINHNVPMDNVIYYIHTDMFTFGWDTTLSSEARVRIEQRMEGFPYKWSFDKV